MIDLDGGVREASLRMVPDGWSVGVGSQWMPDRDAVAYQFTFRAQRIGLAYVNGKDMASVNGDQTLVALLEKVVSEAMDDAGVSELDRLRAWKAEASMVLAEWDALADEAIAHIGDTSHLLGWRKVDIVRMVVGSAP